VSEPSASAAVIEQVFAPKYSEAEFRSRSREDRASSSRRGSAVDTGVSSRRRNVEIGVRDRANVVENLSSCTNNGRSIQVLLKGTRFQVKVWEALLRIPEGTAVSYGELAKVVGRPGASRAVGNAVGKNPIAYLIPCHRVLRSSGQISGYRWGETRKRAILAREAARAS